MFYPFTQLQRMVLTCDTRYACGRKQHNGLVDGCADIENVLATHRFGCIHDGCTQQLKPIDMKSHEPNCSNRRFKCMIPECDTKCLGVEFVNHFDRMRYDFDEKHLINASGIVKQTDIEKTPHQLIAYYYYPFLLMLSTCKIRLLFLGPPKLSEKYVFNVEHKNGRLCNKLVESFDGHDQPIEIPKMENDDFIYIFVTRIDSKSSFMDPTKLLNCPVCNNQMAKRIYQCKNGHLICNGCRKDTINCPTCDSECNTIRNVVLEEIAEDLNKVKSVAKMRNCPVCNKHMTKRIYQCKNGHLICNHCTEDRINCPTCDSECNTIRNVVLEEIAEDLNSCFCEETRCAQLRDAEHYLECPFAAYPCPLCDTILENYVLLYVHIKSQHDVHDAQLYELVFDIDLERNETIESFLFKDYYLFKFLAEVVESTLKVTVHLVAPRGNQNKFKWRIQTDSDILGSGRLDLARLCAKGNETAVAFNSPNTVITVPKDMMLPFVVHNMFTYTIDIEPVLIVD